jgi:hypothetical protein
MRRLFVLGLCGLVLVLTAAAQAGTSATVQDPEPATIAALQTTVAGLSTSVVRQSTQISDLQTAVTLGQGTPVASPTELPDPQSLEITITFRADPDDVESKGLGSECSGTGRFDDLVFDADIAIYDDDEDVIASAKFVGSELVHEGVVFHECEMRFQIEDIPNQADYIVAITHRSVLTLDYAELEEMDWELNLNFSG